MSISCKPSPGFSLEADRCAAQGPHAGEHRVTVEESLVRDDRLAYALRGVYVLASTVFVVEGGKGCADRFEILFSRAMTYAAAVALRVSFSPGFDGKRDRRSVGRYRSRRAR